MKLIHGQKLHYEGHGRLPIIYIMTASHVEL